MVGRGVTALRPLTSAVVSGGGEVVAQKAYLAGGHYSSRAGESVGVNKEGDHQVAFLLCMVRCTGRSQQGYQSTMAAIQPKITSGML